jgi:hypothetical protein
MSTIFIFSEYFRIHTLFFLEAQHWHMAVLSEINAAFNSQHHTLDKLVFTVIGQLKPLV